MEFNLIRQEYEVSHGEFIFRIVVDNTKNTYIIKRTEKKFPFWTHSYLTKIYDGSTFIPVAEYSETGNITFWKPFVSLAEIEKIIEQD